MAKHKAGGSKASQHKRPDGKRLGVKVADGQGVGVGQILVRQRGSKFNSGVGAKTGRDHTLFAINQGTVSFGKKSGKKFVSVS